MGVPRASQRPHAPCFPGAGAAHDARGDPAALTSATPHSQAQTVTSIASELRSRNMTLAVALLEAANMTSVLSAPAARYTLFV